MRVLIVEHDEVISALMTTLVAARGNDVQLTENGDAGLQTIVEWRPEVIIMSFHMAEGDGVAFVRRLRE